MTGKLSIVSTPIGNMGDITYRAIEVLKECDLILAEDTRTTIGLLKHYQVPSKVVLSFFEGNEDAQMPKVLQMLVEDGTNVALVSESGTPLVSDPGYKLVREAVKAGVKVESIPGPTALVAALTSSGLPTNAFLFLGFLPKKSSHARKLLIQAKDSVYDIDQLKTIIFYESPHRLLQTLENIKDVFGDVEIVVARELTKLHEEVRRELVSAAIQHFAKHRPKGEFVLLLEN